MQSQKLLAVCFLTLSVICSPLLRAEAPLPRQEPSVLLFSIGIIIVAALAVYVVMRIRSTIRDHSDKPAE